MLEEEGVPSATCKPRRQPDQRSAPVCVALGIHLWRCVSSCATGLGQMRAAVPPTGKTEVDEFQIITTFFLVDKIFQFQVSVDHLMCMDIGDSLENLLHDVSGLTL